MRFRTSLSALGFLIIALSVTSAVASTDSARNLLASGRLSEALETLNSVADDDVEVRFLRGVVLAELDRDAEAEGMFRDLIREYPDYPEPYNNLAVLLAEAGRYDEAVETLKSAMRTHSSYRTAWDNLTTIYGRLASEAYSRALNVDDSSRSTPVKLVLLGTLAGSQPEAMAPVESIPAIAVVADSQSDSSDQVPAEPMRAEPIAAEPVVAEIMDEPVDQPAEETESEEGSQEMAAEETPDVEEADIEPAEAEEPVETDDGDSSPAELTSTVEAWAASWSEQRVDDYLSFYSSSFTPGDDVSLEEWQALRRSRIEAPESIKVAVALLDYEVDGSSATVVFNQSYESNTFSDIVTKTLVLSREDEAWKIVRETVSP